MTLGLLLFGWWGGEGGRGDLLGLGTGRIKYTATSKHKVFLLEMLLAGIYGLTVACLQ